MKAFPFPPSAFLYPQLSTSMSQAGDSPQHHALGSANGPGTESADCKLELLKNNFLICC